MKPPRGVTTKDACELCGLSTYGHWRLTRYGYRIHGCRICKHRYPDEDKR